MASLAGQQLKDTYDSLLKVDDNGSLGGTYKEITDGLGNGSNLYLGTGGRVGIGDSTPALALSIGGDGIDLNGVSVYPTIKLRSSSQTASTFEVKQGTGANPTFTVSDARNFIFESNSNERMRIDSSGKVGIGTTSPSEKLQIVDTANDVHVRIGSGNAGINPTLRFHGKNTGDTTNVYADIRVNPDNQTLGFSGTGTSGGGIEQDALVIDSSGNVGIGTTPSFSNGSGLEIERAGIATLRLQNTSTGKSTEITQDTNFEIDTVNTGMDIILDATTNTIFEIANSEVARFTADGLTFNGDTTSANALDDYEEGTWTPVYAPSSGSFTTMTMDVSSATYTKIGRQVTVRTFIFTDNVSLGTASGSLRVTGLPFASAGSGGGRSAVSVGFVNDWVTPPDSGVVEDGQSYITLRKTNATNSSAPSDLTTGANADKNEIILTATYFV